MKLGLDKPAAKKAMRVATVFTGVSASAFAVAPAATAATIAPAAITPNTVRDRWRLSIHHNASVHELWACEYFANRAGHSCSRFLNPAKSSN